MHISIYGYRHHAFITAVCLGTLKHQVTFYDAKHFAERKIQEYDFEFTLPDLWKSQRDSGQITLSDTVAPDKDIIHWVFVNQASLDSDTARMYVDTILSTNPDARIIISGLVPIGFCQNLVAIFSPKYPDFVHNIAYIPFIRLSEGNSVRDFFNPDLFVIGHDELSYLDDLNQLLRPIQQSTQNFQYVSTTEAEMIRASINALLATRLSFMNELALLAEKHAVDIRSVAQAMEKDGRIGQGYLNAGCGFGGKTFPAELQFLSSEFADNSAANHLINAVNQINSEQKEILFQKLWRYFNTNIKGLTVAVWGGAYKKGTARTTNSPVHTLLEALWAQGIATVVYDPTAQKNLSTQYREQPLFSISDDPYECITDCDALMITGWNSHEQPNFALVNNLLKTPVIFDGRNLFDAEALEALGIEYYGIGYGRAI